MKTRGSWPVGMESILWVLAASLPLAAAPINVTNQTTASLHTDDALFFTLATYGFGIDAAEFGASPYPVVVSFSFVSGFAGTSGMFDAALETPSGSVIAEYPDLLQFVPGEYQGSGYEGQVGVIEGSLTLSPGLSQQLFSGASAVLVLQNLGPAAGVGLPPFTIAHDLTVSLYGEGLSTGAPVVEATLDDPPPPGVPEPASGWLLAAGAALCWAAASAMERARRRRPAAPGGA